MVSKVVKFQRIGEMEQHYDPTKIGVRTGKDGGVEYANVRYRIFEYITSKKMPLGHVMCMWL